MTPETLKELAPIVASVCAMIVSVVTAYFAYRANKKADEAVKRAEESERRVSNI
ncbi:MAG: hypothetical protein IT173_12130 [Acidobacteria bacterium]|mgnify:FL=1|nr:hypothetical protein [Acidobacteriota bacterium]